MNEYEYDNELDEYEEYLMSKQASSAVNSKNNQLSGNKLQAMQQQMRQDEEKMDRKPFVRTNISEDVANGNFLIGNQLHPDEIARKKMDNQRNYRKQLEDDKRLQPIKMERKPYDRSMEAMLSAPKVANTFFATNQEMKKGTLASLDDVRRKEREKLGEVDYFRDFGNNQSNALPHIGASQPARGREFAFENAPSFAIGQTKEDIERSKIAMREKYVQQLDADISMKRSGQAGQTPSNLRRLDNSQNSNHYPPQERYGGNENPSNGLTSFQIGGASSGNTTEEELQYAKYMKQLTYKQLLDEQRIKEKRELDNKYESEKVPTFAIGQTVEEVERRKISMRQQYLQQLNSDVAAKPLSSRHNRYN